MELQYSYYNIDDNTISATYFGLNLIRPFQYKINLMEKKGVPFYDNIIFVITEMNTGIERTISKGELIDALAKGKDLSTLSETLFEYPRKLLKQQDVEKYESFIIANKNYFTEQLIKYELGQDMATAFDLMALDIMTHFAELLKIIFNNIVVAGFDANQK